MSAPQEGSAFGLPSQASDGLRTRRQTTASRSAGGLSRRRFFELAGGGVVVLVGLGRALAQDARRIYPEDFNAYLVVGADGRVKVFSGKIEMGQGVLTSQAQMAAEELGVDLSAIDMVLGDTDQCPWDMGTFGSLTTRMFGPALRAAAAQARLVLLTLASEQLGVPVAQLAVKGGVVSVNGAPGRTLSYAQLSHGARITRVVDQKALLQTPSAFRVMGTSAPRLDALEKVTGGARYSADIRRDAMLYARVLRPPMHGARLSQLDSAAAAAMAGVRVVRQGELVAVLHADPEAAEQALGLLKADWLLAPLALDQDSIFEHIVGSAGAAKTVAERGDLVSARQGGVKLFESSFFKGYVAHAAMEPHAALAEIRDGRATVWASTQTPFPTRDRVAKALGLDADKVRLITPFLGGGFGGKSADEQAVEAALLAQSIGQPVQVAWTRAEEFFNDHFDPASVVKLLSGVATDGRLMLWDSAVHAAGERAANVFYRVPNARIRSYGGTAYGGAGLEASVHPFPVGPWRGPGANMNVFAIESQMDIMAASLGIDALAFRLANLDDARMRGVLLAAAAAFGWSAARMPSGRGFGLACCIDAGSYVATMAEVRVNRATGKVTVLRIVCAQDMGVVVNPEGAKMQIEGGLTMGLGYVLSEELRFAGGEILDRNFDSYEIPVFSGAPRIEVVLVRNDELAPQGAGEPAITTTGAVIANAVFDACGARVFRLPLLTERIKKAMA